MKAKKTELGFKDRKPLIFVPGERRGEWVAIPDSFVIEFEDPRLPYDVCCSFKASVENGLEIVKFEVVKKDIQITNKGLSKVPVAMLLAMAIDEVGVTMKPDGKGSLKGSLLEIKEKGYSDDVKKRATKKRRKNSVSLEEAKRVADFARRLIDQGDRNWSPKTQSAFSIDRATMNRRFVLAKFKPAAYKRQMDKFKI